MKTHNIILLILLFVCTNVLTSVLLAQDKEVNMVSKKAKLKTIKYKKYNYTAVPPQRQPGYGQLYDSAVS